MFHNPLYVPHLAGEILKYLPQETQKNLVLLTGVGKVIPYEVDLCQYNQLTLIQRETVNTLYCCDMQLTELPALPQGLTSLDCSSNLLIMLPSLPKGLTELYCNENLLSSLRLPDTLVDLQCSDNILTELPPLPSSLVYLNCENNRLASMPRLPCSVERFYGEGNLFTHPITTFLKQDGFLYFQCKQINRN